MNRRGFIRGVLAALGLAKSGLVPEAGATPYRAMTPAEIVDLGDHIAVISSSTTITSPWPPSAVHRDDYIFFAGPP